MTSAFWETEYQKQFSGKTPLRERFPVSFRPVDELPVTAAIATATAPSATLATRATATETAPAPTTSTAATETAPAPVDNATSTTAETATTTTSERATLTSGASAEPATVETRRSATQTPGGTVHFAEPPAPPSTLVQPPMFAYGAGNTHMTGDVGYLKTFNVKAPASEVYPMAERRAAQLRALRHRHGLGQPAAGRPSVPAEHDSVAGLLRTPPRVVPPPESPRPSAAPRYLDFMQSPSSVTDVNHAARDVLEASEPSFQSEYRREFVDWSLPYHVPGAQPGVNESPVRVLAEVPAAGLQSQYFQDRRDRKVDQQLSRAVSATPSRVPAAQAASAASLEQGFLEALQRRSASASFPRRVRF